MKKKILVIILLLIFSLSSSYAQSLLVSGITDPAAANGYYIGGSSYNGRTLYTHTSGSYYISWQSTFWALDAIYQPGGPLSPYFYTTDAPVNPEDGNWGAESGTGTISVIAVNPGGVSGAELWLKSDAGTTPTTGTLTAWSDQTGIQTTQMHGIISRSLNGVNFNPTILFGTNPYVSVDYTADLNTSSFTFHSVIKVTGGSGYRAVVSSKSSFYQGYIIYINSSNEIEFWIGKGSSPWTLMNGGSITVDKWYLITATYNSSTSTMTLYLNGELVGTQGSVTLDPNPGDQFRFGCGHNSGGNADYYFQGYMPEFIYFSSALSASDQSQVESYLATKYGISLGDNTSAVDYKSSSTATIWTNTTYKYDIFGIGQDDDSDLNQTSSNSMFTGGGDGTGQSGEGNIVISTPSDMVNGEFLFLGNDNGSLSYSGTNLDATFSNYQRVARQWIVDKTNDVGTITLEFDMTGITTVASSTASDFALLYDTDDDLSNATTKVDASSISGNKITFNSLSLTDGDRFTFMALNTALPVELTSFTAASTGSTSSATVLLNWTTATEVNNYGFDIERKNSDVNKNAEWKKIGFVEGHGNSNSPKLYSFSDNTLTEEGKYSYRLKQVDIDGQFEYSDIVEIVFSSPLEFELGQNYPNPFNPSTTISYSIPNVGAKNNYSVQLIVYDVLGNEVATLVNKEQTAGNYTVEWNVGTLSSGVYFYRLQSGNFVSIKKLMLMK